MAIAAANATYVGTGPAESGQILAFGPGGDAVRVLFGFADFTGDGTDTDATLNWIDGTKTLEFTPRTVLVARAGGDAAATAAVSSATSITNASALITFSVAPVSGKIARVAFAIFK